MIGENITIAKFSAEEYGALIVATTGIAQTIKKAWEWIKVKAGEDTWLGKLAAKIAHGGGPKYIVFLVAAAEIMILRGPVLSQMASDGILTLGEGLVILEWCGISMGAFGAYWMTKPGRKMNPQQ